MSGRRHRVCLLTIVAAGLFAAPVLADAGTSDTVTRLEAALAAQQRQIEALEQQVAASAQADMDAARTEQMKQQIREVLGEAQFREQLMTSTLQAGYDNGFFIRSTDDNFMMKFNGLMQFRWTYYATRTHNRYLVPGFRRSDRAGFDINRARFRISGHAYSKDLTYLFEFDSSSPQSYNTRLMYGWVNYRVMDEFQVKAGIFRLASTRADFGSIASMQFVDYPTMNAVFGLGSGLGVRLWGDCGDGQFQYYLDIVNTLNNPGTQTITNDETLYTVGHDNNPAIVFRTVWAIMGGHCLHPDDEGNYTAPCDLAVHDEPAWNLGFHYAFNEDWHDGSLALPYPRTTFFRPGGFGLTSSDGMQMHQFGFDTGFKYQGFSLTAEYVMRILDVRNAASAPFSPWFLATGDDSTTAQHGAYVQCGYLLPIPGFERKFEVVGRVGGVSTLANKTEGTWTYAGGLNYYIDGHRVKLQTDLTYVPEAPISSPVYSLANVNDDALIWRVQFQLAF